MNANILIIDDCADSFYPLLATWSNIHELPIEWKYALSGSEGISMLRSEPVDLVLMDGYLIGEEGHEVIAQMRLLGITTRVVMFSSDEEQNQAGLAAGAEYAVNKKVFFEGDFDNKDHLASLITLAALEK